MFVSHNTVRMHDTDMAGILYFAKQFRFAHEALEDLFESEGYSFDHIFHHGTHIFVIVHAEADYLKSLKIGDKLQIHTFIEKIGTTSISFFFKIYRNNNELVGTAKTVHVCLERKNRTKSPIPGELREKFSKYIS